MSKTVVKKTLAKRLNREDLKALPGFTKIWMATEEDDIQDGVIWHYTVPAVVFNSGDNPIVPCDIVDSIATYEVSENFAEWAPDISFWDSEPLKEQLRGISEEEYNSLPEGIKYPKLSRLITGKGMSFKTFCEAAELDLDEFNQMITGQREKITTGEFLKIWNALNLDEEEIMELFEIGTQGQSIGHEAETEAAKMNHDFYNPETWTEQDKRVIDACIKLPPEELEFLAEMMKLVDADPQKRNARADFAEQQAMNYKLRTAEGRESFMEAMRAI